MSNVETIVEQPVAFEAMLEAINDLSVEQLSKLALTGNTRLFKLINSGAVKAKKTKVKCLEIWEKKCTKTIIRWMKNLLKIS